MSGIESAPHRVRDTTGFPQLSLFPLLCFIFLQLLLFTLRPRPQQECAFHSRVVFYFKAVSERGFQTRSSSSVAPQGT